MMLFRYSDVCKHEIITAWIFLVCFVEFIKCYVNNYCKLYYKFTTKILNCLTANNEGTVTLPGIPAFFYAWLKHEICF